MLRNFRYGFLAVIAGLMLAVMGQEVRGQELCPNVPFEDGWLRIETLDGNLVNPDLTRSAVSLGILGTAEQLDNGDKVGSMDWLYCENSDSPMCRFNTNTPSFQGGHDGAGQVIAWYNQNDGRNTTIQVTNIASVSNHDTYLGTFFPPDCNLGEMGCAVANLSLHIVVLNESCLEIKNFCDTFTPRDTHVYDLGDLVSNVGQNIGDITSGEGTFIVTPVLACGDDNLAIEFEFLNGYETILNSVDDFDYSTNLWGRTAQTFGCQDTVDNFNNGGGDADVLGDDGGTLPSDPFGCRFSQFFDNESTVLIWQNFNTLPTAVASRSDLAFLNFSSQGFQQRQIYRGSRKQNPGRSDIQSRRHRENPAQRNKAR